MDFKDKILNKQFTVTGEIGPPKGIDLTLLKKDMAHFRGYVDACNVTDLQSSVMRVGSLVVSKLLLDNGIEPIFQVTCRDRNRLALQSDLLSAYVMGIKNVLSLTGDHPALGDHPDAKPVYDLDAVTLLDAISKLNSGVDMAGNDLKGKPEFFAGAVVNPGADPIEPEIIKMEKKIKAGARFFQSQAVFDIGVYERFAKMTGHLKVPVLAGIVLLRSAKMAKYMNDNVAGVNVPETFINRMHTAKDRRETAIDIAVELIKRIRHLCQGVHIMPIGLDELLPRIVERTGLEVKR